MKKIENILLKACGFTILILALFYSFASFGNLLDQKIGFSTFALIFAFGIIISLTTLLLKMKKPALLLRILLHYASLLSAFLIIFIASGNIKAETPAKLFIAIIIFSFLYALLFGIVYLIKKIVNSVDARLEKKQNKKSEYKSIYTKK